MYLLCIEFIEIELYPVLVMIFVTDFDIYLSESLIHEMKEVEY
jgi:hypothetical protein